MTRSARIYARVVVLAVSTVMLWLSPVSTVAVAVPAPPSPAVNDGVTVVNTETVKVDLEPNGQVTEQRIYEQLSVTGIGSVNVANPVSTDGLRNLDGFGDLKVRGGEQVAEFDVDGTERLRMVSDYDRRLPLELEVGYWLNGEKVEPGDVVDADGELEVRYRVENVTAETEEITFADGTGGVVTRDADVVVPMVGSLTTTLPARFTGVRSDAASIAGDGAGGTTLTFGMTLFPPIGSAVAKFGYTAQIQDGVVPAATMSALPVNPLESPYQSSAESYRGGIETAGEFTGTAAAINDDLLNLRDGATNLLRGLVQLRQGAGKLDTDLAEEAAPESAYLADRADDLSGGLDGLTTRNGRLASKMGVASNGAGNLVDNAGRLASRLDAAANRPPELIGSLRRIRQGLGSIDGGLRQLSAGVNGLAGRARPIQTSIQRLVDGIGSTGSEGSLLWTVSQLRGELEGASANIDRMVGQVDCAADLLAYLTGGAAPSCADVPPLEGELDGPRARVLASVISRLQDGSDTVYGGLEELRGDLGSEGVTTLLGRLECGLSSAAGGCDARRPGLLQELDGIDADITRLLDRVVSRVQDAVGGSHPRGKKTLRGDVSRLLDDVDQVAAGNGALVDGLGTLSDVAGQQSAGTGRLRAGLGELTHRAKRLADSSRETERGSDQLAENADALAAGLGRTARGSGKLTERLGDAKKGAPRLKGRVKRLAGGESRKLVRTGSEAVVSFGEQYALIEASAVRALDESMAFGAPEGAVGSTAYAYQLRSETGEAKRNWLRAMVALALFGIAVGGALLRRRLF
ncbi:MAG: hypothetical protein GEU93_04950 [Propionibacteriales bacterium]|nr:hypothetical protein [Propionibacteriales bacterium]